MFERVVNTTFPRIKILIALICDQVKREIEQLHILIKTTALQMKESKLNLLSLSLL